MHDVETLQCMPTVILKNLTKLYKSKLQTPSPPTKSFKSVSVFNIDNC